MEGSRTRGAGLLALVLGVATLATATPLAARGTEPFATWYYVFAWYAVIVAVDGALAAADPRRGFHLLSRPAALLALLAWSVVFWLIFELLNFRLRNWHYVFVPDRPLERWGGITLSFATVLPALFLLEEALRRAGVGRGLRSRPLRVTPRLLRGLFLAGAAMLLLPMAWPTIFFPLAWGAVVLLLEPANHRADPSRSLLGDLERGRPGRAVRLLIAGLVAGLLWESFNVAARGAWIYTVPGLEEAWALEMPPLGFLGFPPFALEAFAFWSALVFAGLAPAGLEPAAPEPDRDRGRGGRGPVAPPERPASRPKPSAARVGAVAFTSLLFSGAVLLGMERRTISSHTPRLAEMTELPARTLEESGYDVFALARSRPEDVAASAGLPLPDARRSVDLARLTVLRGIGTANARLLRRVGVSSVEALAAADPDTLTRRLSEEGAVVDARVRVWVRGARAAVEEDPRSR